MGFGRIVRGLMGAGFLAASLFASVQADATTYNVTTSSACTLVLAVKAVNTLAAQGSCSAGSGSDKINLAAGTYTLNSTLTISRSLLIDGVGVGSSVVRCNIASGGDCIVVGPSSPETQVTLNVGKFQVAAAEALVGSYTNLGAVQDGYASSSSYTSVTLPNVTFSSFGTKFIRFTVTGKNGSSSSYQVFPDFIELTRL